MTETAESYPSLKAVFYPVLFLILFACVSVSFSPILSKAQLITDFVNETGPVTSPGNASVASSDTAQIQQQLQQQLQTFAQLSQSDFELGLQAQLQEQQATENELEQQLQAIPNVSSQLQQRLLGDQIQSLQDLVSLPPEEQKQFLQQEQQRVSISKQGVEVQLQLIQNSEQSISALQNLISLSPEEQRQIVQNLQQQLLQPTQQTQQIPQLPQPQAPQ